MALFVINRFLGDEDDSSEDRSQALLERLREKAKARQLEKEQASVSTKKHATPQQASVAGKKHATPQQASTPGKKHSTPQQASDTRTKEETPQQEDPIVSSTSESKVEARKRRRSDKLSSSAKKKKMRESEDCLEPSQGSESDLPVQSLSETVSKKERKKKRRKRESVPEGEDEAGEGEDNEGVEENKGQDLEAAEEAKAVKTDPDTSSIVLGGFEKKLVPKVQRVLPQWLSHPSRIQKGIKQHLVPIHEVPGIHPKLLKKLQANKIQSFFPVQAEVIPAILESTCHGFLVGRGGYCPSDICVSAPTGSGKTLAFVIPVIQALLERVACRVRALVVLPTKELAQQVCKVFNVYTDGTSLKVVLVTGQKSFAKEQETLVQKTLMGHCSLADIVVATPGRLVDHIEQTPGFCLRQLRFLIIDEADRMMDTMSQDWLNQVTRAVYRAEEGSDPNRLFTRTEPGHLTAASTCFPRMPLQKLLFSATLTQNPEKLQQLGLYQPRLFTSVYGKDKGSTEGGQDSERNYTLPEGLTQYYVPCNLNSKPLILLHFLVTLKFTRVLCFTNSREASHRLFLLVRAFGGVCAAEFSSLLSPGERQRTLKEFEQGKIQILISTDATARGIDIKGVKCVINYDAPQFIRVYIHRVGRTARAGKPGLAFTMLLNVQEHRYLRMMKDAGTSALQKQLVKTENMKPLLKRYEEALSELQRTVKDERVKKRA